MILIRKLKNPILCRNVVQGLIWPLTTFVGSSVNREMAIEKILKISSNKKCNTPQDAMFCAIIFDLLSHNRPTTAKEEADVLKEINRMMSNSLAYIPQLSLSQSLLLANKCLELISLRKLGVEDQLLTAFIEKIDRSVEVGVEKDGEGKHLIEIINYVNQLITLKKLGNSFHSIFNYLVTKPKSEAQIISIIDALCRMKTRSKLTVEKSIKKMMEVQIGSKVDRLPLSSKLIDQSILRIFFDFQFHIKQPYNCVPVWIFTLTSKLYAKYSSPEHQVPSSKRIQFFNYLCRMFSSAVLISECWLTDEMLKWIPDYYRKIFQVFEYIDEEPMEEKVHNFLHTPQNYNKLMQQFPLLDTEQVVTDVSDSLLKILERYFMQIRLKDMNTEEESRVCQLLLEYCLAWEDLLVRYPASPTLGRVLPRVLSKIVQIYSLLRSKNQDHPSNYFYIVRLLPLIAIFSCHPCLSRPCKSVAVNLVSQQMMIIEDLGTQRVLELYKSLKHTDFVTTCYLTSLYLGGQRSTKFEQMYDEIKKIRPVVVIEAFINCPLIRQEAIKLEYLKFCQPLRHRMELYLQHSEASHTFPLQKSLSGFSFRTYEEELVGSLILLFKVDFRQSHLDSRLYSYWFRQNEHLIVSFFGSSNPALSEKSWHILRTAVSYLSYLTHSSGVDLISEIMRILMKQQGPSLATRFIILFTDRKIYQILFKKTDELAKFKYIWIMGLLVNYAVSPNRQSLSQGQPRLKQKIREQTLSFQVAFFFKLIQQISFCSHDLKEPLQVSTYRSQSACKLLNESMQKIVTFVYQEIGQQNDAETAKRRQLVLCKLPIEQIIYFLNQHNQLHPSSWLSQLDPQFLLSFMKKSYNKISQYNILLSFDQEKQSTKKLHHAFISEEIWLTGQKLQTNTDLSIIYNESLKSTVLKFYFYFLAPDRHNDCIDRCTQMVGQPQILTQEEVLSYWLNKNIVIMTIQDQLIEAMVQRLIGLNLELTYTQFQTTLNTIITLFSNQRIRNYSEFDDTKIRKLAAWVHQKFLNFTCFNFSNFLKDYFVLAKHFPSLSVLSGLLQSAINDSLLSNRVSILEHIYESKMELSQTSIEHLKNLLVRFKMRCLTKDYFGSYYNCDYRIQFILKKMWGAALMQGAPFASWFWENILTDLEISQIREHLSSEKNRKNMYALILRYRLSSNIFPNLPTCSLRELLCQLSQNYEQEMQGRLSRTQEDRAKNLPRGAYASSPIGCSQVRLYQNRNEGKFIYLIEKPSASPEEHLEILYICSLQKLDLELRSIQ